MAAFLMLTVPTGQHIGKLDSYPERPASRLPLSKPITDPMAEPSKGTKWVHVDGYIREDGTKVRPHDRSTPDTSTGRKPKRGK